MAVKYINFTWIPVHDQDRAIAFYTGHLGFSVQTDAPYSPGWRWVFLTLPGGQARLNFAKPEECRLDPHKPALTLVCDSVDDEAARLKAGGVEIHAGPDDAPWMQGVRWMMIRDSEENLVLLESWHGG